MANRPLTKKANIKAKPNNTDITVLSESFFAIAFAIWKLRKKTKLKEMGGLIGDGCWWQYITTIGEARRWFNELGITSTCSHVLRDPGFQRRINLCWAFLNGMGGTVRQPWGEIIPLQMDGFFASPKTKFSGSYVAMRADMIPKGFNPYKVYDEISKKVKKHKDFKESINPNKWNPADVWIFSPVSISSLSAFVRNSNSSILNNPEYDVGYMNQLNKKIYTLYKLGQLYPVSLKAPSGSIRVVEMNADNMEYKQEVRYINVEYDNNNVDVKLNFAIDLKKKNGSGGWKVETTDYMLGRMKTKSATVSGFGSGGGSRLEIEITKPRGGARYGSLGTNIQEVVIEKTETSGIRALDRIRHGFPDLYKKFGWGAGTGWHGRKEYENALKEDPEGFVRVIKPYTDALYKELGGGSSTVWDPPQNVLGSKPGVVYVSKTHAGEIGVAVDKILREFMKGVVLENLFNIASSQQVQTGTQQEQIERRSASLGRSIKADLEKFPPSKADLIWKSGFHLVVK
jgi:hypothetical protein